ncbi:ribosome small subunit-dependent GTPase A [Halocynthiibacter namhaensis]|uniref:ribosome small subunit-dependent GTPase A n=1 Tax=Halocynthiibacter namhaensis TaxID=1290553 RepID=UPI000579261A|nr:ribosome small subunit-dependent GTPase A [Halocynthiibacter namhaensis]
MSLINITSLTGLGWSSFFAEQFNELDQTLTPARISEVRRDVVLALGVDGAVDLITPPDMPVSQLAVGDWVLARSDNRVEHVLNRKTLLSRRAAGHDARSQLIAANVDVLFITTSCNADFNAARLERYLVMACGAGCTPVVVLTKADLEDPAPYVAQALELQPGLAVIALNAKDPSAAAQLMDHWKIGETAALLGSSGVGKSTLTNALTGVEDGGPLTAAIREDDAKGRHTTTTRNLYPALDGRWIIDTPGMRELQLLDAQDGLSAVFSDLEDLSTQCKFRNCAHSGEPGCAIGAAIKAGDFTADRLHRWQKLAQEDAVNTETVHDARSRGKATTRDQRRSVEEAASRKGKHKKRR